MTTPPTFHLRTLDDVRDRTDLQLCLEREDVLLIRGLFAPQAVRTALARLQDGFSADRDTKVDHKSRVARPRDVPSYQRLMVGEFGDGEANRSFFMRVFYSPMWNPDPWGMRPLFRRLTILRNLLQQVRPDLCLDGPEDDIYTLSRIHHYPAGGGFLGGHRDSVAMGVPSSSGIRGYIQVLLVMSRKGEDFQSGGGYYVKDGRRVFYESFTQPGDVVVYNGRTLHGVQTIDPQAPTDLASPAGRYSAVVTLYRLRKGPMNMG